MSNDTDIHTKIEQAMPGARFAFRRKLGAIRRSTENDAQNEKQLSRLTDEIEKSIALRKERRDSLPEITFPAELPITERWEEIADALKAHQVIVVCGDTGSGKSTQLPKICLAAGRGVDGVIGHTQPRRIAARTIASRLADELHTTVGQGVGYKVRFTDATQPATHIKLMTDGVLLAETASDKFLNQYDTIIIDEAHERSLNIDFLLGYLKQLLAKRPDLKLIITSATIDAERFADHFSTDDHPAPVIEVSGRTFPIETIYLPPADDSDDIHSAVADAVEEATNMGGGDVLVFLPTERDIRAATRVLRGRDLVRNRRVEILPLYSRLSVADQNRVFAPHGGRRIVLATNVAESSLTVPGIRFVIDTGDARMSRYSTRSKMQRLPIEAVSQASADQRKGRCGRVGPGICIRLFSEEDYLSREAYTTPEIRRSNLAAVILQAESLRLGSLESFPFLDAPRSESIRDGYRTLFELGAMDERRRITPLGRQLSRLPVDPRIGRMVLAAAEEGCLAETLVIASALEVQDPRERPVDRQQDADASHSRHAHADSDFLSYLKLWEFFHQLRDDLS
ncbi:MAG: ATP-dependent RNA helicase HrpA, partial [bacterium]|nr:ATP-dependent RNA helicase HrpA [bacterium]